MVTGKAYNQGATNHLVVPMTFDVTINKDAEATSRSPPLPPSPSAAPPPPPPPPTLASPDVTGKTVHVTDKTIRTGRGYYFLSGDGEHVLSASRRKSDRKSAVDFNKVSQANHLVVHVKNMTIEITIKEPNVRDCYVQPQDGDAASPSSPPPPPPPLLLPPSPPPTPSPPRPPAPVDVTAKTFRVGRSFHVVSADGERVLSASSRKSDRKSKFGGFRLDFLEDRLWETRDALALFTFSGHPGAYRMHSGVHHNNMLYFLGHNHQLDWVVWDWAVPTTGEWEVMDLHWLEGEGGRETFKMEFFGGLYVKWVVSGFTGVKELDSATEFVLREI